MDISPSFQTLYNKLLPGLANGNTINNLKVNHVYSLDRIQDIAKVLNKPQFLSLADGFCPKCNNWGQKRYRIFPSGLIFMSFVHYGKDGKSRFHHKYYSTCYIGEVTQQ